VGARLGAHFARGCSVVLGCARFCSVLTWVDGTSGRSGEWWWQSLQARGRWFEPTCAHGFSSPCAVCLRHVPRAVAVSYLMSDNLVTRTVLHAEGAQLLV
jgi:hypothetical protein